MRDAPKETLISKTLIAQIEGFIHRNGGDHASFVVGITDDTEAALRRHAVVVNKNPHFTLNAVTGDRADGVITHFASKGCAIGDAKPSGFVYCYRRAFNTTP